MKKLICIVMILLTILLCACTKQEGPYRIVLENPHNDNIITSIPETAKCGETVVIKAEIIMDAGLELYANGKKIEQTHFEDYWGYTFVMPDHDVTITMKWISSKEQ